MESVRMPLQLAAADQLFTGPEVTLSGLLDAVRMKHTIGCSMGMGNGTCAHPSEEASRQEKAGEREERAGMADVVVRTKGQQGRTRAGSMLWRCTGQGAQFARAGCQRGPRRGSPVILVF